MFSRPSYCCYVRQNTLLTQCVFKVSAFGFNACTKTCAPLSDCCINNALIHFVPSCQDTCTQFVNVLDLLLVECRPSALRTTLYSRPDLNPDCLVAKALEE